MIIKRMNTLYQSVKATIHAAEYCLHISIKFAKKYTFLRFFLQTVSSIVPVSILYINKNLLNCITHKDSDSVFILLYILFFVTVSSFVLEQFSDYIASVEDGRILNKLSVELSKHCMSLESSHFDKPDTYNTIQLARLNISIIPSAIWDIWLLFTNLLTYFYMFILLARINLFIAICLTFAEVPYSVASIRNVEKRHEWEHKNAGIRRRSDYFERISYDFSFVEDIRGLGIQDYITHKIDKFRETIFQNEKKLMINAKKSVLPVMCLPEIAFLIFAIHQTGILFATESDAGDFLFVFGLFSSLMSSTNSIISGVSKIHSNSLRIKTIEEFMSYRVEKDKTDALEIDEIETITFQNVVFRYPGCKDNAIDDISFVLRKNESVCFVGENGSGKTTIIKLLLRLYDPLRGKILINDIDIKEYSRESIRKQFSIVLQSFHIFPLSLIENIQMGSDNSLKEDQMLEVLRNAGGDDITKKIDPHTNLTKLFDSKGYEPSLGESQKIALARAFFRDTKVFVFDEPSSSLDPISEYQLIKDIEKKVEDKTVIYTAHRLNTVTFANKIIVIQNGKIIEEGTKKELIEKKGTFYRMYVAQKTYYDVKN